MEFQTEFNFLVICQGATHCPSDGTTNLTEIVTLLRPKRREPTELTAVVGAFLGPEIAGHVLDLFAWRYGSDGELLSVHGEVLSSFPLPELRGPAVLQFPHRNLRFDQSGVHCFQLVDRDGAFGSPNDLLSTYTFGVDLTD